jgi:hypothetical protein
MPPFEFYWASRILDYPIINFGRYCSASAKCVDWISSLPAKSAMVRGSFRMRDRLLPTN